MAVGREVARDALHSVADRGEKAGLAVSLGGNAVQEKAGSSTELIGLLIAAVALVITFGSLLAAGLPLLTAIFGVGTAVAAIMVASSIFNLSSAATTLALMLGLAVAIDHALFIVSRYRGETRDGHEPEEAAGRALGTAGSAVVFAGLTVVIALAGLSIIGISMLTTMGLGAAFAVVVAVLIALTLLPAMLGFAGTRIMGSRFTSRRMRALQEGGEGETTGVRWARFVTRNPLKTLVVSVVGLGVLAIPALSMRLALPDDSMSSPGTSERIAYDTITKGFGDGYNGPLTVVIDGPMAALGLAGKLVNAYIEALQEHAVRLEKERDQRAQLAAATERARVAREMHDILGHTLAVIVGLAGGAAGLAETKPKRGADTLRIIADSGRGALAELRRLLAVIHDAEPDDTPLAPQPGLADLNALMERVRAAGPTATLHFKGERTGLAQGLQLAVYRIVQEALTNTLKHTAPNTTVEVKVTGAPDAVIVTVEDTGPHKASGTDEQGKGLVGMRERAAPYGGQVVAGPNSRGGWTVRALLVPLPIAPDLTEKHPA
ncbi:MMPL family transporter [Streptomyces sp. NPDC101455]|uniref:MMPL family transporter n=1 Tax=Streptomyces sp. NPDC101455 TaxID=3366142 RepID=UPI0037F745D4